MRLTVIRSKEAFVCLHPRTQHIWPNFLSFIFSASLVSHSYPQLGSVITRNEKKLIPWLDSHLALRGLLMFCTCSCLTIMPPAMASNLSHHWGPNGDLPQGNGPEHMLGHLECPQGHDLLTTLELPILYGAVLQ
jgi:hypothetical protein